jgi:hypothetical protein
MIESIFTFFKFLVRDKHWHFATYLTFIIFLSATTVARSGFSSESNFSEITETPPIAFPSSYIGVLLNQNHPYSYGESAYSEGGPSWGAEYRFFYKDTWTLAIAGSFKQLDDASRSDAPIFSLSQETLRLVRLYHPWYFAMGARLLYFVPVRRIMLPYERDQTRSIDTGAAVTVATIWKASNSTAYLLSANRWRSLSTSKKQGIEVVATALFTIR